MYPKLHRGSVTFELVSFFSEKLPDSVLKIMINTSLSPQLKSILLASKGKVRFNLDTKFMSVSWPMGEQNVFVKFKGSSAHKVTPCVEVFTKTNKEYVLQLCDKEHNANFIFYREFFGWLYKSTKERAIKTALVSNPQHKICNE